MKICFDENGRNLKHEIPFFPSCILNYVRIVASLCIRLSIPLYVACGMPTSYNVCPGKWLWAWSTWTLNGFPKESRDTTDFSRIINLGISMDSVSTSFKINCAHHSLTSAIYLQQSILLRLPAIVQLVPQICCREDQDVKSIGSQSQCQKDWPSRFHQQTLVRL